MTASDDLPIDALTSVDERLSMPEASAQRLAEQRMKLPDAPPVTDEPVPDDFIEDEYQPDSMSMLLPSDIEVDP